MDWDQGPPLAVAGKRRSAGGRSITGSGRRMDSSISFQLPDLDVFDRIAVGVSEAGPQLA